MSSLPVASLCRSLTILMGVVCVAFSAGVGAQDRRAIEQLAEKGFVRCAKATGNVLEFLYEKQSFAYLNTWNSGNPDRHIASTLTSRPYADGHGFASVVTAPSASGACDAAFTQLVALASTCSQVQESSFKNWKATGELGGIPIYADPSAPSVVVMLLPTTAASCLVVKSGVLFF